MESSTLLTLSQPRRVSSTRRVCSGGLAFQLHCHRRQPSGGYVVSDLIPFLLLSHGLRQHPPSSVTLSSGSPHQRPPTPTTSSTKSLPKLEFLLASSNSFLVPPLKWLRKRSATLHSRRCTSPARRPCSANSGRILRKTWTSTVDTRASSARRVVRTGI